MNTKKNSKPQSSKRTSKKKQMSKKQISKKQLSKKHSKKISKTNKNNHDYILTGSNIHSTSKTTILRQISSLKMIQKINIHKIESIKPRIK